MHVRIVKKSNTLGGNKMPYIRYFATNRHQDDLTRVLDQSVSRDIQRGGFHWIDAKRYMSYYLAETKNSQMPKETVIHRSNETIYKNFLSKPSIKRIIIGIHGFNVPLHGALTSFSILADTLRDTDATKTPEKRLNLIVDPTLGKEKELLENDNNNLTAMVGFSWPSNGSVMDYSADRVEAVSSASGLAGMINVIHQANPTAKVFIIAHSMGNFLTCHMLKGLIRKEFSPYTASESGKDPDTKARLSYRGMDGGEEKFFVDGYFMLAPDIERRQVTKCYESGDPTYETEQISEESGKKPEQVYYTGPFFDGIFNLVGGTYLFYSRHDQALKASRIEKEIRERKGNVKRFIIGRDMDNRQNSRLWDDNQWDDNRWEDSLGLNPCPPQAPPNMYSFNASTLAGMEVDHGNYFDMRGIVEKIAEEIVNYRSPHES